jgi:hypothetical protein
VGVVVTLHAVAKAEPAGAARVAEADAAARVEVVVAAHHVRAGALQIVQPRQPPPLSPSSSSNSSSNSNNR